MLPHLLRGLLSKPPFTPGDKIPRFGSELQPVMQLFNKDACITLQTELLCSSIILR